MHRSNAFFLYLFIGLMLSNLLLAQGSKTLAEQLGYAKEAKLLIIHADDLGVTHSENSATIAALEKGVINSAAIMVPCPWFPEIAAYAKQHPTFDWGLHLTITSEWDYYKWDGVVDSQQIPGLINNEGYFYASVEEASKHGKATEVEKEIRAQIEKATSFGVKPTHLDPHMNGLFSSLDYFKIYFRLGREYRIPVLVPRNLLQDSGFSIVAGDYQALVESHMQLHPGISPERWQEAYDSALINMKPGLNELVLHLAYNDEEMKAVTIGKTHWWDAAWRQRDYDYITSQRFKEVLRKNNIQLVTWNQIKKLLYP
jgi:chitin disaccharide deacetylase